MGGDGGVALGEAWEGRFHLCFTVSAGANSIVGAFRLAPSLYLTGTPIALLRVKFGGEIKPM